VPFFGGDVGDVGRIDVMKHGAPFLRLFIFISSSFRLSSPVLFPFRSYAVVSFYLPTLTLHFLLVLFFLFMPSVRPSVGALLPIHSFEEQQSFLLLFILTLACFSCSPFEVVLLPLSLSLAPSMVRLSTAGLVAGAALAYGQTFTSCNPMTNSM